MAGRGDPTFQKRQKEMNRIAKANAKRAAQQTRREDKAARTKAVEETDPTPTE
jgi:hypothetical protein